MHLLRRHRHISPYHPPPPSPQLTHAKTLCPSGHQLAYAYIAKRNILSPDVFEIVGGTDYAFGACFIAKVLEGGKGGGLQVGDRILALGGHGLMYATQNVYIEMLATP